MAQIDAQAADADEKRERYRAQSVRIFVTTHKDVEIPEGDVFQPVQVGAGLNNNRFIRGFHDDEGENISAKNPMYCELTTQYWAWKNENADYYGFCHYRRYFDLSPTHHEENRYGEIMDDYIDAKAITKYRLNDQAVKDAVAGYDIVTTVIQDLRKVIDHRRNPVAIYETAPYLHIKDLDTIRQIIADLQPDYKQDADDFFKGHYSCFCNMYIMRKQLFFEYCEWMFPLLEEFERRADMTNYSTEALRTPGHLSERLFNIWLMHKKRTNPNLKTRELQCVHFTNPERAVKQAPLDTERIAQALSLPQNQAGLADAAKRIIPVAFAADNNYVPMLATTIYSLMSNASSDRFYDIAVLQRDISPRNQSLMRNFFAHFTNMNLRFIDVGREVSGYELTTSNPHISVETYYRFLIQKLLPFYSKVLYLDADLVVRGDVAKLYDTDLGNNLLAATHDIDYLGNLNHNDGKRIAYSKEKLAMSNPYDYFQAGVLLLNTAAMRQLYTMEQWLGFASNPDFIYNDQDVLNAKCQGRVRFLDWRWNVMHDCDGRVAKVFTFAPHDIYNEYMASRTDPQIIHYAGYIKPWTDASCDFADIYWNYARQTPFYEQLIEELISFGTGGDGLHGKRKTLRKHEPLVGETSGLRRFIDPLAPVGSRRRELLKAIGRKLKGTK